MNEFNNFVREIGKNYWKCKRCGYEQI